MNDVRAIWFETHATSLDNEAGLASGRFDVDLSPAGIAQAAALGRRYQGLALDRVLTSDLRRAWRTAAIAFGSRLPIHRDPRLGECDYGRLTRASLREVEALRLSAVDAPFPGGESYEACVERVRSCLAGHVAVAHGDLLIIGHRATHYALQHLLAGVPLRTAVAAPWRWQAGWKYEMPPATGLREPPTGA